MKKFLSLLLTVAMVCSLFVTPALAADPENEIMPISESASIAFPDAQNHWAKPHIDRWSAEGIVQGDQNGNVNPGAKLTLAELATMLQRLLGLKDDPTATFADLKGSEWYAGAIRACKAAGILGGDQNGNVNATEPISRERAVVVLGRALGAKASADPAASLTKYPDGTSVSSWAAPYMAALTDMGILTGIPTADGSVAAPADPINRASTLALLDKAIESYITVPGEYQAEDPNRFVVVNVPAAEDAAAPAAVTVSGETAGVTVVAGNEAPVTLSGVTADSVKVDSPVAVELAENTKVDALTVNAEADVNIGRGNTVGDLTANAPAQVTNKGVVDNLVANDAVSVQNNGTVKAAQVNADDVVMDGKAPQTVETAEGVSEPTNSSGKPVTGSGSTSSSTPSTPTPTPASKKYKVTLPSVTGGTVSADVTETDTADTEVTLTVTPNPQNGASLPYILKEGTLKVTGPNGDVAVNANKFTMADEGTYTVTAEFVQPITQAELFLVNDQASFDKLKSYGYEETPQQTTYVPDLKTMQWLAVGLIRAEGYNSSELGVDKIENGVLTANGETVNKGFPGAIGKYSSVYVDHNLRDEDPTGGKLELTGAAYKFVLTFDFKGAHYTLTADYNKVDAETGEPVVTHKVTFKENATNTTVVEYNLAKDETVALPPAPDKAGYVFKQWQDANGAAVTGPVTMGEDDIVITAQYLKITDAKIEVRPAITNEPFDYQAAYQAAGVSLSGNKITVNQDTAAKFVAAALASGEGADATKAAQLDGLKQTSGAFGNTDCLYIGVAVKNTVTDPITKIEVVNENATTTKTITEIPSVDSEGRDTMKVDGQVYYVEYFPFVEAAHGVALKGINTADAESDYIRTIRWYTGDNELAKVERYTLGRNTTNVPQLTVTFKTPGENSVTLATKTVAFGGTPTLATADEVSSKIPAHNVWDDSGKWYTDAACTTEYSTPAPIYANLDLYAKLTPSYTVTFMNGDTKVAELEVKQGGAVGEANMPADPEAKAGYEFKGWVTTTGEGSSATESPFTGETAITANTTVTAKWDEITYSVTVNTLGEDGNGGGSTTTWTVSGNADKSGTSVGLHGTEDGYTFDGWYYTNADGEQTLLNKSAECTVAAADLPNYAKADNTVTFTPVYTTEIKTVEAMSQDVATTGYAAWADIPKDTTDSSKVDVSAFGSVSFTKGADGTWTASGTVNYVTGFTGFYPGESETAKEQQEGYYLLFMTETPARDTLPETGFIGQSNKGGFGKGVLDTVDGKTYFSCIVWLGQAEPAEGKTSTYTLNWSGLTENEDGTTTPVVENVKSATLSINTSGLTFKTPDPENP